MTATEIGVMIVITGTIGPTIGGTITRNPAGMIAAAITGRRAIQKMDDACKRIVHLEDFDEPRSILRV
jgi:hypothetical protein